MSENVVEEVSTKSKETKEAKVEVDLSEDKVTLELLLKTRECVVS